VCDLRVLCGSGWELRCYGLLCGELWYFVMGYCVVNSGNMLWDILGQMVVICYGLLCAE